MYDIQDSSLCCTASENMSIGGFSTLSGVQMCWIYFNSSAVLPAQKVHIKINNERHCLFPHSFTSLFLTTCETYIVITIDKLRHD